MKTKRTMFILGAIFTLLSAILTVAILVVLYNGTEFTPYAIQNMLIEMNIENITINQIISAIKYFKVIFIFHLIFLLIIMFVSFNAAFKKSDNINKFLLVTTLVISWLFNNIIASIFITVGYFSSQNIEETTDRGKSAITKEIESIRSLYNKGAITKEEYDKLVNELFNKIEFS